MKTGFGQSRWLAPWARLLWLVLALSLCPPDARADTAWDGRYLALGMAIGRQGLDLDGFAQTVNGHSLRQAGSRADIGLAGLGYRAARGGMHLGGEIELQPGPRSLAQYPRCVFGQNCAAAGLLGRVGPIYRLRATMGRDIGVVVLMSGGLGISMAKVSVSHAFAQAASAQDGSGVITSAISPFAVDDLALGAHVVIGVEHRVSARAALRVDLVHERLWVDNHRHVFILTTTTSGNNTATAQISEAGRFVIDATSVRLSLVMRF